MSHAIRIVLIVLAIAATAAACSSEDPAPPASPSSAFSTGSTGTGSLGVTGGSGASGATGATSATGGLPTTSPGSATGHVEGGTVRFELTGDLKVRRTLDLMASTVYEQPPGGLVLVWTAGETDSTTVGIGGSSFTGTMPTSASLTLTLVVQTSSGIGAFQSRAGECEITIDVATEGEVAGGFRCAELEGVTGQVVRVSGTFRAEA